jgi:hypothetical protein
MTELQKEFEATGYTSWINADLYPDEKIYTQEYTQWLERQVLILRQPHVIGSLGFNEGYEKGWTDATSQAISEIQKNYKPDDR